MRKLLALLIILLLVGCYTTMPVPVHTMSDSQLQHEYLEKSSELASEESKLQIQRQPKDFQKGMTSSLIYTISKLRERLTALRIEMSKRGLYAP